MCDGTGVIETGNNDLRCPCPIGAIAIFNVSTKDGMKQLTGAELSKLRVTDGNSADGKANR